MKIKSANYFRQKYHTDIRGFKEGSGYDVDYIGSSHTLSTGERVKGFFDLYHGDKESIVNDHYNVTTIFQAFTR